MGVDEFYGHTNRPAICRRNFCPCSDRAFHVNRDWLFGEIEETTVHRAALNWFFFLS